MNYKKATLFFLLSFIVQASLLNLFSVFGATPNLILCLVVVFSFLYEDDIYGVVLGVVFGLLYDICYMPYVGVSSIGYLLLGLGVLFTRGILNKENITTIMILTASGSILYNIFIWLVYAILGSNLTFTHMLGHQPVCIILNLAVVCILYAFVIRKVIKHRKDRFYQ